MRVQVVDPPAYTPPYDRSLCSALARAGADVELVTSRFAHGPVAEPEGYRVNELFYRRSTRRGLDARGRRPMKLAEHVADMVRFRRSGGGGADVVHYQWLPVPVVDGLLIPARRPRLLTAHGILRGDAWEGRPSRAVIRLLGRMDAVVSLFEEGAERLRAEAGMPAERVHVIPHGALDYLATIPGQAPLPAELAAVEAPVVLCFGIVRPYKGVDVLLRAFAEVEGAELWVVGRPLGVDMEELLRLAAGARGTVRFVSRFVPDHEVAAYFQRADVVALPHRHADQSGALFAALAFGKPIVASAVGGLRDVADATGAARLVPPGDAAELGDALATLLGDAAERERLGAAALAAARGPYSWDAVAARTLALYRQLLSG